ncbi:hypothetical protein AGRA3207_000202 [Actinomadura graeca]|uniref:Uncharacterized protein n=1 Tax=Actinomadura graeca TaxID=2750812 RepID=A0ABX8R580_9ACTN|nr:hypothetical protein AGRA3207_000202 [Actinomadura graeca]
MARSYDVEITWLEAVVEALEALGQFNTSITQPYGSGAPFLHVVGHGGTRLAETIRVRRVTEDDSVRGVWSWEEDVAGKGDPVEAAKAIHRVTCPRM